jgi:transposase
MGSMKENEGIHRHDISDEAWERIKELLPGQAGKRGGVANLQAANSRCSAGVDSFFRIV